jgi:hypothetical protein
MSKLRLTATVKVVLHHTSQEALMVDYQSLQARFNHVKAKMLQVGDDITMDIKVEKVETPNG